MSSSRRPTISSLDTDTSHKSRVKSRSSPPRTPTRASATISKTTNGGLDVRPPRETFLDDITPVNDSTREHDDPELQRDRDSHDLSLSPRQITRDSLVDNMLLSLDQFSYDAPGIDDEFTIGSPQFTSDQAHLYTSFADEEPYDTTNQHYGPVRNGMPNGHGHSYSSDYENADDASMSRYSSHTSRGRRSNSSSAFQPGLGRINSIRNDGNMAGAGLSSRGPTVVPGNNFHSRSGAGSKGSSANSVDLGYAQMNSRERRTHGSVGRASSTDYGYERRTGSSQSIRNVMAPNLTNHDYEAAPTPTVPVGPRRRMQTSIDLAEGRLSPVMHQIPEGNRPVRPSKSKQRPETAESPRAEDTLGHQSNDREVPSPQGYRKANTPAPAPASIRTASRTQETVQLTHSHPSHTGSLLPTREKPGFFRRVFGSSRTNLAAASGPVSAHGSSTSIETPERPASRIQHVVQQSKPQVTPQANPQPLPPKDQPPTLSKKPSSFFRRRKKSISDSTSPPPLPAVPSVGPSDAPQLSPMADDLRLQAIPSPVSSLRQVMNPYISSPVSSAPVAGRLRHKNLQSYIGEPVPAIASQGEGLLEFLANYTPDQNGTSDHGARSESRASVRQHAARQGMARIHTASTYGRAGSSLNNVKDDSDGTFLRDNSDNEAHAPKAPAKSATPLSPSAAAARDMALVAEYERTYSRKSPVVNAMVAANASKLGSSDTRVSGHDDEWIVVTPKDAAFAKPDAKRIYLEPTPSEEDLGPSDPSMPQAGPESPGQTPTSATTVYKSSTSLPILQVDGEDADEEANEAAKPRLLSAAEAIKLLDRPEMMAVATAVGLTEPTDVDREQAKQIFDGDESVIQQEKAAAWLGGERAAPQRTLKAYMELYNFANLNILAAFRILCGKLVLKAESQQVDRILDAFSKRWCQCNPDHGFKVTGKAALRMIFPFF